MNNTVNNLPEANFYFILTFEVARDKRLTDKEKILFGLISSLTQSRGYCFASNKWFEDFFEVSQQTISKSIQNLKANNYIDVEYIKHAETGEILERHIYLNLTCTGYTKKFVQGIQPDLYYNNKDLINSKSLSETPCSDSIHDQHPAASSTTPALEIQKKRLAKIYNYVQERLEILQEKKIIQTLRKMTDVRSRAIKNRIKDEPSILFWRELFDKIEKDADIFSRFSWFNFDFLFVRKDKIYRILEGYYDHMREENPEDISFENKESQEFLESLCDIVTDNLKDNPAKKEMLAQIVEKIADWSEPGVSEIGGEKFCGFCNFHSCFSLRWNKVYQDHINNLREKNNMPVAVSTIKIGSECWKAFEKEVKGYWTFIDKDKL